MTVIRKAVAIIAVTTSAGCYTWRPVTLVENPDPSARPSKIEVTSRDGRVAVVREPVVRGDSLHGWYDEDRTQPFSVATADVSQARTLQLSSGRTVAVVAGGVVIFLAMWLALIISSLGDVSW